MKRIVSNFFAATALLALGATASACPLAYAVNFSGQFGLVDLATGAFTPVGTGLDNIPDGIMGVAGGPFYSVDGATGHLIKITTDGKSTDVGDTHTGPQMGPTGISIIGSLADGTLYALSFDNVLYRIDKETGALTKVGSLTSLPDQEEDYSGNMVTSLTGDGDKLYFTIEIAEGARKIDPRLFVVSPTNPGPEGVPVVSHPLKTPGRVVGSGLVNGTIYSLPKARSSSSTPKRERRPWLPPMSPDSRKTAHQSRRSSAWLGPQSPPLFRRLFRRRLPSRSAVIRIGLRADHTDLQHRYEQLYLRRIRSTANDPNQSIVQKSTELVRLTVVWWAIDSAFMVQARQDSRDRKIAHLQAQILELQARLAEAEKHRGSRELALIEDGLRLSQENEVLRRELALLKRHHKAPA